MQNRTKNIFLFYNYHPLLSALLAWVMQKSESWIYAHIPTSVRNLENLLITRPQIMDRQHKIDFHFHTLQMYTRGKMYLIRIKTTPPMFGNG